LFFCRLSALKVEKTPCGASGWSPEISKAYSFSDRAYNKRIKRKILFIS
jgi:hypothetical protein